jgi:hypothetical protein
MNRGLALTWIALAVVGVVVAVVGHLLAPLSLFGLVGLAGLALATLDRGRAGEDQSGGPARDLPSAAQIPAGAPPAGYGQARAFLIAGVSILSIVFLLLLADALLVAFPVPVGTTSPWRIPLAQALLGRGSAAFGDLIVGVLILGSYAAVTAIGTRERGRPSPPWLAGAVAGAVGGLGGVLVELMAELIARDTSQAQVGATLGGLLLFGAPVVAGIAVGNVTGRATSAILGGFWCGLVVALVHATGGLATDLVLAARLAATIWVGNLDCPGMTGTALAACSIRDDLGGWGVGLLILPLLGASLGGLGGLLGRRIAPLNVRPDSEGGHAMVAPLVFSGLLLCLFAAEMAGLLW